MSGVDEVDVDADEDGHEGDEGEGDEESERDEEDGADEADEAHENLGGSVLENVVVVDEEPQDASAAVQEPQTNVEGDEVVDDEVVVADEEPQDASAALAAEALAEHAFRKRNQRKRTVGESDVVVVDEEPQDSAAALQESPTNVEGDEVVVAVDDVIVIPDETTTPADERAPRTVGANGTFHTKYLRFLFSETKFPLGKLNLMCHTIRTIHRNTSQCIVIHRNTCVTLCHNTRGIVYT